MSNSSSYKNWTLNTDDDGIVRLVLDRADSSANSLNKEVLEEFYNILSNLKKEKPKGLAILSGKNSGFIAGADIEQFTKLEDEEEAFKLIRKGQEIFDLLEELPFPTVACIDGFCLGGGFELAIACDYRIVTDSPKTKLGLPEVMLGIHPGWGGTVRLPRMIGSLKAMDLILTGRTVVGKVAKKMGFVDACIPLRHMDAAIKYYINKKPKVRKASKFEAISNLDVLKPILAKLFRSKLSKKIKQEHYPAPFAVVDNWLDNNIFDDNAYLEEAKSIGRLIVSDTAQNLVKVFFMRERLKSLAKASDFKPTRVHVIGAGVMGGDIAAWCALRGLRVTIQDTNLEAIAATCSRALKLFTKKLKIHHLIQDAKDRLTPDPLGGGVKSADIIIEAIVENVEAKQGLFKFLEENSRPDAILATNTSTIPLNEISSVLKNPKRLIGIHFFNPVAMMPLVEVIQDENSDPNFIDRAMAFVKFIDKLPLPVNSSPGFLVNRLLMPYLMEAIMLLEEGIPGPVIDKAATDFGMPMGPVELADTVGLDVCVFAATSLGKYFGGSEIPDGVKKLVEQKKLGKKTGQGFYNYKKDKVVKPKVDSGYKAPEDIADRLILRIINEAFAVLREGVIKDEELLDAGMIFGTGFAPFLGGPMNYVKKYGSAQLKEKLEKLEKRYGKRFTADDGWSLIAA